jgi:hypothetical protein
LIPRSICMPKPAPASPNTLPHYWPRENRPD